jgi:hypothetical protein
MLELLAAAGEAFIRVDLQVHQGDSIGSGREPVRIENIDAPDLPHSPKAIRRAPMHGATTRPAKPHATR